MTKEMPFSAQLTSHCAKIICIPYHTQEIHAKKIQIIQDYFLLELIKFATNYTRLNFLLENDPTQD